MIKDKHVILLVGPPGSGKSTIAKRELSEYAIVSQDEFNGDKNKTMQYFHDCLKTKNKIIVDKMNLDRKTRLRFSKPAKDAGFKVSAWVVHESFSTCYNRAMKRENHKTIKKGDRDTILKVLRYFKKNYRRPTILEENIDNVHFVNKRKYGESDFYMTDACKPKIPSLIIGDPHGCFMEFSHLLKYTWERTGRPDRKIITVGDLIDKGPDISGVLNWAIDNHKDKRTYHCLSNHDYRLLRYLRGNKVNTKNMQDTLDQISCFSKERIEELMMFLEDLTPIIQIASNAYVVHAGINPTRNIEHQDLQDMLYIRSFKQGKEGAMDSPEDDYWYKHPKETDDFIFFGHNVDADCWGENNNYALDSGCVYGNGLTAAYVTKEPLRNTINKNTINKFIWPSKKYRNRP